MAKICLKNNCQKIFELGNDFTRFKFNNSNSNGLFSKNWN